MTTDQHLLREELTQDEHRERKTDHVAGGIETGARLLIRKAGLPTKPAGGRLVLDLDKCWCPEPHRIDANDAHSDLLRMYVLDKSVFCPVHRVHFNVRQLLDLLPLGKRKSQQKKDDLLALINWNPEPVRYYAFQSGDAFETTAINTDPVIALNEVHPSPKLLLRGVLLEVASIQRVREILDTKSDDLPWCSDLRGRLRDDLSLSPSWHGATLTVQETGLLHRQALETAVVKRKARMKMIEQLRRDADRLTVEPL
jgi:hypothetical protein